MSSGDYDMSLSNGAYIVEFFLFILLYLLLYSSDYTRLRALDKNSKLNDKSNGMTRNIKDKKKRKNRIEMQKRKMLKHEKKRYQDTVRKK